MAGHDLARGGLHPRRLQRLRDKEHHSRLEDRQEKRDQPAYRFTPRVLRDRKKLKQKVQAVFSEAKASAAIIGSLPFIVGILVWFISPRYIELLWLTSGGRIVIGVCLTWMLVGCLVMRKIINFEV